MGENVRVYDFKVETCDDSGEPGGPPPSAVCAALVGTDNGRIVEVFEDGGDAVSYSGGSFGIYDLLPTADDPADVFAVDSTAPSALASTDAGDSWIATASDSLDYGTNAKDEAGKLYRRVLSAKSIETSDDGVVWTSLITGLANGPMALWVGDSHIWWTENADST